MDMRTETDNIREFDFSNGIRIGQSEIDVWHKEAVKFILDGKGEYYIKSTGNSILIARKVHYTHEDNPGIVVYEIINGYKKIEYLDVVINAETQAHTTP